MPLRIKPLTDQQVKAAKPGQKPTMRRKDDKRGGSRSEEESVRTNKPYRMFDGGGLYLEVDPNGGKWCRLKYRFNDREKRIALGVYPAVTLAGAREKRHEIRKMLSGGTDPGENRKAQKSSRVDRAANSFEVVAREWLAKFIDPKSESHRKRVYARFENDIFPRIGARPIAELTPQEVREAVERIETRGAPDSAHRTLGSCGQVLRYGVASGRCERNFCVDLRDALTPVVESHFAAVTKPAEIARVVRALDVYKGTFTVQCALRLAPLVFVRPGELRKAEWKDFDLDDAEWCFELSKPRDSRQRRQEEEDGYLIVPLSRQSITILREMHSFSGGGRFVFPGARSKSRPMSDNTILGALRNLGIPKEEVSGHGFRATARTAMAQELHERVDLIEHQLGHRVIDPNGRAYNRATFLRDRRKMMQRWADYLDKLKATQAIAPAKTKHP